VPLFDLTEFLKLSSVLNYNLSAASLNRYNVLLFIIGDKPLHTHEQTDRTNKSVVMEALDFLLKAYSRKKRRLGPMAVIHPIRATALFSRSQTALGIVPLLTALFHDVLEDIKPVDFPATTWREMESQLFDLLKRLDPQDEKEVEENLARLTKIRGESYYGYIGRLLDSSGGTADLVQIKLADRLDNTLDMRIDLQDPLDGIDFFENIFQTLFVRNYGGYEPVVNHPASTALNGARRLYQL